MAENTHITEPHPFEVDQQAILEKLEQVQALADGDIARMLELLLAENVFLQKNNMISFYRGQSPDLTTLPRFLQLVEQKDSKGHSANSPERSE